MFIFFFFGDDILDRPTEDKVKPIDVVEINRWNELISNLKDKVDKQTVFIVERGMYSFDLSMVVAKIIKSHKISKNISLDTFLRLIYV